MLSDSEIAYKMRKKQLKTLMDLNESDVITSENVGYKVTDKNGDFQQKDYEQLIGRGFRHQMKKDTPICYNDLK